MKKAIVIGATSGIGMGLAKLLVEDGYTVGITGRRTELLESLSAENPSKYFTCSFDIKDTEDTINKLNALFTKLGSLDLVVISSGTGNINEPLDFGIEKDTIETNVLGFTQAADWAFNIFRKNGHGQLVAITSVAGLRGGRHAPAYGASKSYQINYLEALRQKAAHLKLPIVITDIRPGFVDTAMAKGEGVFWAAEVKTAARQILNAINKKRSTVYVTRRWGIVAFLMKHLPWFLYSRI